MDPPKRGHFGEAEIWLKADARPVSVSTYRLKGEKQTAHKELVQAASDLHNLKDGKGHWNTPSFKVPKKRPYEWRLVQDYRPQNASTMKDGHPLPLISVMLQRQGKIRIWSVFDLVDGYHQTHEKGRPLHYLHVHASWHQAVDCSCHGPQERKQQIPTHDGMSCSRPARLCRPNRGRYSCGNHC
jgi:hypothetical protein